jgi:hypothetical protein
MSSRDTDSNQADRSPGQPIPLALRRPPNLIGRDATLARMRDAWRFGQVLVIEGDAGVGKTRLLDEFIVDDGSVGRAGARAGDAAVPLSSLARLLTVLNARYRPDLGSDLTDAAARDCGRLVAALAARGAPSALTTDADHLRFNESLRAFLAACLRQGARGLVFDDLHLADAASIETLGALLDDPVISISLRVAIALRRPEEGREHDGAVAALLEQLATAGRIVRIEIKPLDSLQVGRFLDCLRIKGLDGERWGAALTHHTGGNPAFLVESLKTLLAEGWLGERAYAAAPAPPMPPMPPTVASAIDRRLHLLGSEALALAHLAATAGADFDLERAAAVLGRPPEGLTPARAELERAQILDRDEFAHDLVQEAVQRSVPAAVGERLHRAIAEQLAAEGAAPGRIAAHFAGGHRWLQAAAYWRAAADSAGDASQLAEQVRFLEQAVDCFDRAGDEKDARDGAFAALLAIAGIDKQPDYGTRLPLCVERLRTLVHDERQNMEVDLVDADLAINRGHYDRCEQLARAALESARRLALADRQVAACARLAHALVYLGRPNDALEELENLALDPAAIADPMLRATLHEKRAVTLAACGRLKLAIADASAMVRIGNESRNLSLTFDGLYDVALMHSWHGEAARAASLFAEAITLRERLGGTGGTAAAADSQLGAVLRDLGRYAEAIDYLQRALVRFDLDRLPGWSIKARAELAETYLLLGQPARAQRVFGTIPPELAPPETAARLVVRSRIERELGGTLGVAARESLRVAAELLPPAASPRIVLAIGIERARDLEPEARWPRMRALGEGAMRCELVGLALYAAALAAATAQAAGDHGAAIEIALRAAPWRAGFEPAVIPRAWMLAAFADALASSAAPAEVRMASRLREEAAIWSERVADDLPEDMRTTFLARLRRTEPLLHLPPPASVRAAVI